VSTITYAINGKQYVCVMTGDNLKVPELAAECRKSRRRAGTTRFTCLPCREGAALQRQLDEDAGQSAAHQAADHGHHGVAPI